MEATKNRFFNLSDFIGAAFIPSLTILGASGLLKGIVIISVYLGLLNNGSVLYTILISIANISFYYLPVFLAMNIAKYFKCNTYINAIIALTLLYPDIISLLSKGASLFGISIMNIDYSNKIFPFLFAIVTSCLLEKLLNKILPEIIQGFAVPVIVLIIIIPVTLLLFGPLGELIGSIVTSIFTFLYELSPILCGAVVAASYLPLFSLGLNWFLVPIMLNNIALTGWDPIMAMCSVPGWICMGISLALTIKCKSKYDKGKSLNAFFSSCFGIQSPVLFGILMPLKKPLILTTILSAIGGTIVGILGTKASAFTPPGALATLLFVGNPSGLQSVFGALIVGVVCFAIGFVGMWIMGYDYFPKSTNE